MKNKSYFLLLLFPIIFILIKNEKEEPMKLKFTYNPKLSTISPNTDWKGNPLDEKGRFVNLYTPFTSSFGDVLKWQTSANPQKAEKKAETRFLTVEFDSTVFLGHEDYLIWLGHASYLIRINGKVILTDPLLIDNAFLKRESPLPFPLNKMPKLDYILLSHNHRDHCDENSIKYLTRANPSLKILTGLGLESVISGWSNGHTIQEAGWFQQYSILDSGLTITYVPSRHWSRRGLTDENKSLWGGFYIQNGDQSIYFMGDSGKGEHFADIKNTLGTPDYCLMGVGAYKPEWFMNQAHISPKDAIDAFNTLEGKFFIPMHFGTFNLSDEPRMEPLDVLLENKEKIQGKLVEPVIGRNLLLK
jgi:L-ascorbate metabolism protein UlaG (beta-lactamase superfamily)